jgi:UDP-N-acetylglucosamine--N-acetylmuramyl-(pentapeptide) pyrophosphoryl-undecaprenol N-acetylglucosamine transferase
MAAADEETRPLRVLIAGGGTGGHLYPGVAVAQELRRRRPDATIVFVGTRRGLERHVVPRAGFPLEYIRSAGLKGRPLWARLRALAMLPLSAVDAWRLLRRYRPDLVIGVGGYSSGPVVAVAALEGVPTMVLEQNVVPGLTNRLLARVVRAAAVSFEATAPYFRGRGFVSGNPVRPEFFRAPDLGQRDAAVTTVLVVGGSQGAYAINRAMVEAAPRWRAAGASLALVHQTGPRDLDWVRAAYREVGVAARVEPYLDAMAEAMAAADLVVCRAGATTLAELAAAGRPAILIPLATATDDHQRRNAELVVAAGAAELIPQDELTGARLADRVLALAADVERRRQMGRAARRLARPDAAARIVDAALAIVDAPGLRRRMRAGGSG